MLPAAIHFFFFLYPAEYKFVEVFSFQEVFSFLLQTSQLTF